MKKLRNKRVRDEVSVERPLSADAMLEAATQAVIDAVAPMVQHAGRSGRPKFNGLPPSQRRAINRHAALCRAEARAIERQAKRAIAAAHKRFLTETGWLEGRSAGGVKRAGRDLERLISGAERALDAYLATSLRNIDAARATALFYAGRPPVAAALGLLSPNVVEIWSDRQKHNIAGVDVEMIKRLLETTVYDEDDLSELKIRTLEITFLPPGGTRPRKYFGKIQEVEAGGRKLTAIDPSDVELGNDLGTFPTGGQPPTFAHQLWGYAKVFTAEDVPPGCEIAYHQVAIGRRYIRPNDPGLEGRWLDVTQDIHGRQVRAGKPVADSAVRSKQPPFVFSDFPSMSIGPDWPQSSYSLADECFRTWVVEYCPGKPRKVLGYWEWGFSLVIHQGPNGVEAVSTPPGPDGVRRPPGGWPKSPSVKPTTWTDAADASPEVLDQYRRIFTPK